MTLGLKFLLWKNKNIWFQNNCRYVFSIAIMYSCETVGRGACIKRMVAVRNYSTNTIIEKKQTEGRVGVMEFSGVK